MFGFHGSQITRFARQLAHLKAALPGSLITSQALVNTFTGFEGHELVLKQRQKDIDGRKFGWVPTSQALRTPCSSKRSQSPRKAQLYYILPLKPTLIHLSRNTMEMNSQAPRAGCAKDKFILPSLLKCDQYCAFSVHPTQQPIPGGCQAHRHTTTKHPSENQSQQG